jgi:hypothetical protein
MTDNTHRSASRARKAAAARTGQNADARAELVLETDRRRQAVTRFVEQRAKARIERDQPISDGMRAAQ